MLQTFSFSPADEMLFCETIRWHTDDFVKTLKKHLRNGKAKGFTYAPNVVLEKFAWNYVNEYAQYCDDERIERGVNKGNVSSNFFADRQSILSSFNRKICAILNCAGGVYSCDVETFFEMLDYYRVALETVMQEITENIEARRDAENGVLANEE